MTPDQLIEVVNSPVAVAVLALYFVWLVGRGGWVPGKTHQEAVQRERDRGDEAVAREKTRGDEWKEIATGVTTIADKAVTKLEKDA